MTNKFVKGFRNALVPAILLWGIILKFFEVW